MTRDEHQKASALFAKLSDLFGSAGDSGEADRWIAHANFHAHEMQKLTNRAETGAD